MLLTCWKVRTEKNCYRGLENVAFSNPRSQVFPMRTDPKPANNIFIFYFFHAGISHCVHNCDGHCCLELISFLYRELNGRGFVFG